MNDDADSDRHRYGDCGGERWNRTSSSRRVACVSLRNGYDNRHVSQSQQPQITDRTVTVRLTDTITPYAVECTHATRLESGFVRLRDPQQISVSGDAGFHIYGRDQLLVYESDIEAIEANDTDLTGFGIAEGYNSR